MKTPDTMTLAEIQALEPGPALDGIVHTYVLGRPPTSEGRTFIDGIGAEIAIYHNAPPEYSSDISEAWQMVARMAEHPHPLIRAEFTAAWRGLPLLTLLADEAALAICLMGIGATRHGNRVEAAQRAKGAAK